MQPQVPVLNFPKLPTLPGISFSLVLNRPILTLVFLIFLGIYAILSGILVYHWMTYGMKKPGIIFAESLFLIVSVGLFIVAGLSITYY